MTHRSKLSLLVAVISAVVLVLPLAAFASEGSDPPVGVAKRGVAALRALDTADPTIGIATYPGRAPTADDVANLERVGLRVQAMEHLPLAIVGGAKAAMIEAVGRGFAFDVYPDEQLEYLDAESAGAINAPQVWEKLGIDGTGVGVAIIDTGIDATHPDLENRVTHNVKMVGSEYVTEYEDHASFVVPVDQGPYNNSDHTSGHGTHVAGIVAADGSSDLDPKVLGVAPGAELIGYSTGDLLFIFEIIATFDHVIEMKDEWNIHVTNNSWGSSYRPFDPLHPINLATQAVTEAGILNVFAAGNSDDEMQINPWSVAPWIVSVGSTTLSAERSSFSSGGLMFDNSMPVPLPEDNHLRFTGDRIGLYHPDVSAPGSNIRSTGTPTGVGILAPAPPGGTATISGTSMATPHVAGLAALVKQANPDLTPDQVRTVMQVTSVPLRDGSPFWRSGYGFVDAPGAVELALELASSKRPGKELAKLQKRRDREVQSARTHRVLVTDQFWFDALPATAFGLETHEFSFPVESSTKALRVTSSFGADLGIVGINLLNEWSLTLLDADGNEVEAEYEASGSSGHSWLMADLKGQDVAFGEWTLRISGDFGQQEGVLHSPRVSLAVAQLQPQKAAKTGPSFKPQGEMALAFTATNDPSGLTAPEGCPMDQGVASGGMSTTPPTEEECRAGFAGYAWNYAAGIPVEFVSDPLPKDTTFGGPGTMVTYLAEQFQPAWSVAFASVLAYDIAAVGPDGDVIAIGGGDAEPRAVVGPTPERGEYVVEIPVTQVPAGYALRVQMRFSGFYTSDMRFLYGGGDFADAGITFTTGSLVGGKAVAASEASVAEATLPTTGAPAWSVLGLWFVAVGLRLRRSTS